MGSLPVAQPIPPVRATEHPLALLSRSCTQPSAIADSTVSLVIRLGLMRAEQLPPAAVLKVAHGVLGAAELRTQRRVLAALANDPALDDEEWCALLPRILAFDDAADATVSLESYRPGVDLAEVLARCPTRVEELTAVALRAIAPLHRRTTTLVVVDNVGLLRRWVVEPLAGLADLCEQIDPRRVSDVDRLGTLLREALVGRRLPVSWTHGRYTPDNVRLAGAQGAVAGIVDWGAARPGQPALIDEYLMTLTASCQAERVDLGTVVAERLRAGSLSEQESNALRVVRDRRDADLGGGKRIHGRVDEHVAILLTWLHHAADLWRNRAIHPDQRSWWTANVVPVLDTVAAWHSIDAPRARSAVQSTSGPVLSG